MLLEGPAGWQKWDPLGGGDAGSGTATAARPGTPHRSRGG